MVPISKCVPEDDGYHLNGALVVAPEGDKRMRRLSPSKSLPLSPGLSRSHAVRIRIM